MSADREARRLRTRAAVGAVGVVGLIGLVVTVSVARAWVVPLLVVLVFSAGAAGLVAWVTGAPDVLPPDHGNSTSYDIPPVHHERIGRVRRSLVQSTTEAASYDLNVRPLLAHIADDRLRATLGITMTTHPDAARARLGEELWQRLTTDSTHAPTEGELRRLVTAIDRLSPPS